MEQQKDDKKPAVPTLQETQRPPLKIKGLQSGQSLIERLKQFKKKDLAFILSGLGVLFMAPLAEHFLMSPDTGSEGAFQQGWGVRPGQGGLGSGGSPFEGGLNGLAPGGVAGGSADVITPLNVRDPSALIMGPGGSAQPPATGAASAPTTSAAPATTDNGDWKDALKQSAAHAAGAATHAVLPVPHVPLSSGGLRGMAALGGDGGANFSGLGGVSSNGLAPNHGNVNDSLGGARASRDFRGVAARGATNANAGSLEALKRNAGLAGADMSRAGPAITNLENAANRGMGTGSDGSDNGGGGPNNGGEVKGPSGSQNKDGKQMGDSLEFLRQKEEMEKAIALKWKKLEKEQMFPIELKQKAIEALVMGPIKSLAALPGKALDAMALPGGGDKYVCSDGKQFARGDVNTSCSQSDKGQANVPCLVSPTTILDVGNVQHTGCNIQAGSADASQTPVSNQQAPPGNPAEGPARSPSGVPTSDESSAAFTDLNSACSDMFHTRMSSEQGDAGKTTLGTAAQKIASALAYIDPAGASQCAPSAAVTPGQDAFTLVGNSAKTMQTAFTMLSGASDRFSASVDAYKQGMTADAGIPAVQKALGQDVTDATKAAAIAAAKAGVGVIQGVTDKDDNLTAGRTGNGQNHLTNVVDAQGNIANPGQPFGDAKRMLNDAKTQIGHADTILSGVGTVSATSTDQADNAKLTAWAGAINAAGSAALKRRDDLNGRAGRLQDLLNTEQSAAGVSPQVFNASKDVEAWETGNSMPSDAPVMRVSGDQPNGQQVPRHAIKEVLGNQDLAAVTNDATTTADFNSKRANARGVVGDLGTDSANFKALLDGVKQDADTKAGQAGAQIPGAAPAASTASTQQ